METVTFSFEVVLGYVALKCCFKYTVMLLTFYTTVR